MKSPLSCELALGMALALESSEADIEKARVLCSDREDPHASRELAIQLLVRAKKRIETVRIALGQS